MFFNCFKIVSCSFLKGFTLFGFVLNCFRFALIGFRWFRLLMLFEVVSDHFRLFLTVFGRFSGVPGCFFLFSVVCIVLMLF